jgi:hypothetical protein
VYKRESISSLALIDPKKMLKYLTILALVAIASGAGKPKGFNKFQFS